MPENTEWAYSLDEECYNGRSDTKETAIEEGKKAAQDEANAYGKEVKHFWVGSVEPAGLPTIDVDDLLERLGENAYDNYGECAEEYLTDVDEEHAKELEEQLNAVFEAWAEKHGYLPKFYSIGKSEQVTLDPPCRPQDEDVI